jgi:hypothetical protein
VIILFAAYFAGQALILHGWLGGGIQRISEQQTTSSGQTLLFAARPESYAAISLFEHRPIGYGPGVVPSAEDIAIAERALELAGTSVNSGYVQQYLFGDSGLELQTVIGDLWAVSGLVGIMLALLLFRELIYSLGRLLQTHRPSPLLLFVSVSALWALFFGTISSNLPAIVFSVVLITELSGRNPESERSQAIQAPAFPHARVPLDPKVTLGGSRRGRLLVARYKYRIH